MALLGEIDLNSLVVFDAVVIAGSFTGAADRLGVAKARVSLQVARLEQRLGVALFHRTTRRVALTDAGSALHAQCAPLLGGLTEALHHAGQDGERLAGSLRVSTTVDHAVQSLAPALARFAAMHPALQVDLRTGDRVVDMLGEGIDVAIRLGWLRDSSLRAVKLGEFEQYLVAAPAYLRRAGQPRRPQDLAGHEWIALTLMRTPLTWKFTGRGAASSTVQMKARLRVDSPAALRAMLAEGAGISVLDQYSVEADLAAGRLVRVLPRWSLARGGMYAVTPPGRHTALKAARFIAFYREWLDGK
ncbi:MAG TPA: LysR family transcriptional regulator [Noviherbaspirillum sp.]|jgi:DNA-binding transcriptional LysR family regulator|uniref:LysR family transcriptional regulator n=1 Tax=Noviherbaspirillum sp. TaxID=1926288 RepID=UPI002F943A35